MAGEIPLTKEELKDLSQQTFLLFQDVLKTSSRHLQDVFAIRLPKTSSRCLQDVLKTSCKASSRRLQDRFARRLAIMSSRRLQDVFKTSWKTKKCYTEDVFKTSSVRLHQDECLLGYTINPEAVSFTAIAVSFTAIDKTDFLTESEAESSQTDTASKTEFELPEPLVSLFDPTTINISNENLKTLCDKKY